MALDTGATTSVIGWESAMLLGCDPAISKDRHEVVTGDNVIYCPRFRLSSITALGLTRRDFPVLCHTLPPSAGVDGLLGLDFLRGKRLFADFVKGSVRLT